MLLGTVAFYIFGMSNSDINSNNSHTIIPEHPTTIKEKKSVTDSNSKAIAEEEK